MWVFSVGALSYFLALHSAPGPSCTFPALVLESNISPRNPALIYWRTVFEIKTGMLDVLTASRSSQVAEQGNLCMYTKL